MFAVILNTHSFESVNITDSYALALLEEFNTNSCRIPVFTCVVLLKPNVGVLIS